MRRFWLLLVLPTVVVVGAPDLARSTSSIDEHHCVVEVLAVAASGLMSTGPVVCFLTFAEAMAYASDGELKLPAGTPGSAVFTDEDVAQAVVTFVLGIHYDGSSGSGSSISITGSSCTGGYWNTPSNWANRISSSWNGCARLRHWDNPSKAGAFQDTSGVGSTDNLTTMNNRAESVSYHSS